MRQMQVMPGTSQSTACQRASETALSPSLCRTTSFPCRDLPPHVGEAEEVERSPALLPGGTCHLGRLKRKSMKRVLSGWSVSPYRARRLPRTAKTRLALEEVLERHH